MRNTTLFYLSASLSLSRSLFLFQQQLVAHMKHVFGAFKLLQVWDLTLHEVDRTQVPYLVWPMFAQLITGVFYFPDYRPSGSARIPFLTHQDGGIHLMDDICGEFFNNLIVIRHRRGKGGAL